MIGFSIVELRCIGRTHMDGINRVENAKLVDVCDKIRVS